MARHAYSCRKRKVRAPSIPKSLPRIPSIPRPGERISRDRSTRLTRIGRWRKRARWMLSTLKAVPKPILALGIAAAAMAVFFVTNLVYQMLHKPTEVFALIPGEANKAPIETWRQYAPLFREYSTTSISPELLAALAQVESAGNPIARTYWRWSLTSDPFAVYQPASSAVGMYQMTDAALSEAQGHCILHHSVVETGCSATLLHSRVVPRHATELTAVFLDRKVTAILDHRRNTRISRQQREELAAVIHLCGTGPATAFARRDFRLMPGALRRSRRRSISRPDQCDETAIPTSGRRKIGHQARRFRSARCRSQRSSRACQLTWVCGWRSRSSAVLAAIMIR